MTPDNYIPIGRTSLARNGSVSLQVQTEYAARPYPRVTTTVLNSGQVVQKIEKRLNHPVESLEEQSRAETIIRRQHGEVVTIIQKESAVENLTLVGDYDLESENSSVYDRLTSIPGFQYVFRLSADGTFSSENTSRQFRKAFAPVFKHLREIVEIFAFLPGGQNVRQKGVYEVERDRLYFVSAGSECYFVTVQPTGDAINYEVALQKALLGAD